ncbi:MAG: VOC family protein [Candidatus Norongarragalinales archaeon]
MDKVVHFEVPADDLPRAKAFYERVFGWKIEKYPMPDPDVPYYGVHTVEVDEKHMPKESGAINGGMMKKDATAPYPVIVMSVESVEKTLKKAEANGAKVVMPTVNVMGMGLYARIKDSEGNIVGVWQDLK